MKWRALLLFLALLPATVLAQATTAPADDPAVAAVKTGKTADRFQQLHEKYLARAKEGAIDLLFLGDSITEGWARAPETWKEHYGKYKTANFGISGDRTQHVLWRIENGELNGIKPKVVVLLIGVNNASGDKPDRIAAGVEKIVKILRNETNTKVLLLGVFPWGEKADDPKRQKVKNINAIISKLDDGKNVRYLDIGKSFLEKDGSMLKETMGDFLHPSKSGYEMWAKAMDPLLTEMMK